VTNLLGRDPATGKYFFKRNVAAGVDSNDIGDRLLRHFHKIFHLTAANRVNKRTRKSNFKSM